MKLSLRNEKRVCSNDCAKENIMNGKTFRVGEPVRMQDWEVEAYET